MAKQLKIEDLKVGQTIQQIFCNIRKKVVFIHPKYVLCEGINGNPSVLLEEEFDTWEILPKMYTVSMDILYMAYSRSGSSHSFFRELDILLGVNNG